MMYILSVNCGKLAPFMQIRLERNLYFTAQASACADFYFEGGQHGV